MGPLGPIIGPLGPIIGPLGPIIGPLGPILLGCPIIDPIIPGPIGPISIVGESDPIPMEVTGFPSGPSIPPSGEFIIPGSRFPIEPRPESGPGPIELGVEQGVDTWVNCWDIWAIEEIGSNPLEAIDEGTEVEVGVAGFSGIFS